MADILEQKIELLENKLKKKEKQIKKLEKNIKNNTKSLNIVSKNIVIKNKNLYKLINDNKFRIVSPNYDNYDDISIGYAIPNNKVLYKEKNKYCQIEVIDSYFFGKILLIDDDLQTTEKDEFIYHEMISHIPLNYIPNTKNVLIIGGGDGGTAREVLKHNNIERIDNVEICKEVIEISKKYFPNMANSFKSKKLVLHIQDGAKYIKLTSKKYDLIIIDSTDLDYKNKIFKKAFYKNLMKRLNKDGILIINYLEEFTNYFHNNEISKHSKKFINILKSNFTYINKYHCTIPSYIGSFYTFLFCSNKINPIKEQIDWELFNTKNIKTRYYDKNIHISSFHSPKFLAKI